MLTSTETVPKITRGIRDNLGISFHVFFHKNVSCDSLLEPSRQYRFIKRSQRMFSLRNKKIIPESPPIPHRSWSTMKRTVMHKDQLSLQYIKETHTSVVSF